MLTIVQGHTHLTYVIVIGGLVLACCAAAAVSKWRCERARRARVRRAVHRPLPPVDGAAALRTFGDWLRDALFDVHCEDALRVVEEDETQTPTRGDVQGRESGPGPWPTEPAGAHSPEVGPCRPATEKGSGTEPRPGAGPASYARHPAVKEAAIARIGDEAEAWLRGRAS